MEIDPQIVIFAGSLVAILALAGLAYWLGLGAAPALTDPNEARVLAAEVSDDFTATDAILDGKGASALLCDEQGRVMLLKRHGNKFAGRILGPNCSAKVGGPGLIVDSGEARFGEVTLMIADTDANPWADAINRLNGKHHA